MAARATLLLAHHRPDEYRRCARLAGVPVCRRCLVLYPVVLLSMIATALGVFASLPLSWRNPALWLLPVPLAAEYTAEAFGRCRYSPRRQVLVTVPAALGGGAGFAWEQLDAASVSFWQATVAYGVTALAVTVAGWRHQTRRRAEAAETARLEAAEARLTAALGSSAS